MHTFNKNFNNSSESFLLYYGKTNILVGKNTVAINISLWKNLKMRHFFWSWWIPPNIYTCVVCVCVYVWSVEREWDCMCLLFTLDHPKLSRTLGGKLWTWSRENEELKTDVEKKFILKISLTLKTWYIFVKKKKTYKSKCVCVKDVLHAE